MVEATLDSWADDVALLSGSMPSLESTTASLRPEAITFRELLGDPQRITPRELEIFRTPPSSSEFAQVLMPDETVEWVLRALPNDEKAQMGEELFRAAAKACVSHELSSLAAAVAFWEARAREWIVPEAAPAGGHADPESATATRAQEYSNFLVNQLAAVSEVERIFVKFDDEVFRVWVVIVEPNRDVEDRIYDAELRLMDRFPGGFFEFSLIFRGRRSLVDTRPDGTIEVLGNP